jgi:hypothetical protein
LLLAALPSDDQGGERAVAVVLELSELPSAGEATAAQGYGADAAPDEADAEAPRLVWPDVVVDDASGPVEWTEVGDPAPAAAAVSEESLASDPAAPSEEVVLVLRAGTGADASSAPPGDPDEAVPSAPPAESLARGPPQRWHPTLHPSLLFSDAGPLTSLQPRDAAGLALSYGKLADDVIRPWQGVSLHAGPDQTVERVERDRSISPRKPTS